MKNERTKFQFISEKKNHFEEQFQESEANFSENYNEKQTAEKRNGEKQCKPIQLVKIKPSGKIQINEQALDLIASCDLPVGFVSLVGKSRTGKSFLLNRLLYLSGSGFQVDSSTSACTEGIWMWSQPFYNQALGNYIFFLDTEGTDSLVKDAENDTKIFTLAVLLSSYFIYNSVGSIDERSLNQIEMITTLSKKIKLDLNTSQRDNEEQLHLYMPKFLWILRDFTLKLENVKGKRITATEYLDNCLTDQNSIGRVDEDSRKIKKSIMNYFKSRQCLTLVRPAGQEFDLQRLNSLPDHALRRQFIDGVNVLRDKIMKSTGAKMYDSHQLTGAAITSMLESYVEAFNSGDVPVIKSAWEEINQNQGAMAFNRALEKYQEIFKEEFDNDQPKGQEIHKILAKLREGALQQFQENLTQPNDQYQTKLKSLLSEKEENIRSINSQMNDCRNHEILKNHAHKLKTKLEGNKYAKDKQQLTADINELVKNYNRDAKGQTKGEILSDFLTNLTAITLNLEKQNDNSEAENLAKIKVQELEKKLKLKEQQMESTKRKMDEMVAKEIKDNAKSKIPQKNSKDKEREEGGAGCCSGDKCQIM